MGVALLGGFGDLNVDRSAKDGDAASKSKQGEAGSESRALAVQPGELMKLRVPELKKKLVEAGVELARHPGVVEKRVGDRFPFLLAAYALLFGALVLPNAL